MRILGPLEVRTGEALSLPGGRARALLALLAIRADTVISTDRIIDQLWGESPPPTARTKLHGLISSLRRRLGPSGAGDLIRTHPPGYTLAIDPQNVDSHRFRQLVERARPSVPAEKAATLRLALDLWRGPALADFLYEPFAQAEIMALEELRLETLEERIDADLALGRHADLVAELQSLVAEYPLRERLAGLLMLALYRGGRQADALAVYRDTRRHLIEQLGVEPGPALQELEDGILAHHPALIPAPQPSVATRPRLTWLTERRKPVTVVFVDLATANTDAEVSRDAIDRAYRVVADILRRHGGTVQGLLGDVVVAVFGIPTAHEDDHRRAARAAIEIRRALTETQHLPSGAVGFRIGLNTGEVVVGDPSHQPSGATVSLASRLQQAARDGEILIGNTTRRMLGETAVSAQAAGTRDAWRLIDVVDRVFRPSPMVARKSELGELRAAFDQAVARGSPVLVEVIGEAGIGKTRLAHEFVTSLGEEPLVLTGRCPAYGEGITYWPLREMLLEAAADRGVQDVQELATVSGVTSEAVAQVAGAAGLVEYESDPRELFAAVRDFLTALSRRRPLVMVVEDLHWAEPTFRDLLESLTVDTEEAILILCLARREPVSEFESPIDGAVRRRIDLPPLSDPEVARLVKNRSGGRRLTPEELTQVVETTRGNPLFAEQIVAALAEGQDVEIPPSIHALLAARLDRLGPAERDVARAASVLGTEFSLPALTALLPTEARPFADRHLRALEEKRLLAASPGRFLGEPAVAFNHVLIQAAAYRSLTRRDRSRLHEQVADWLERTLGDRSPGELVGYHLERAHGDRIRVEAEDQHTEELARRAGEWLGTAGLTAYAKFDMTAAQNLLTRSKRLLPGGHPLRYSVMRRLAETYPVMGQLERADAAFAELLHSVGPDVDSARGLRLERVRVRMISGPDPMTLDEVAREAQDALSAYSSVGDATGMSQACYVLAFAHVRAGRMHDLERVAREGLAHARRSDLREEVGALWYVSEAMVTGPTPVREAIATCEELVSVHGHPHPGVLSDLARLQAMQGEFDRARDLIRMSHEAMPRQFRGVRRASTFIAQRGARVEKMAGDLASAEGQLRWALRLAKEVGERDQVAQLAATLSRVATGKGELDEAAALARESTENSPAESVVAQGSWRAAQSLVLAGRKQWTEARALAREAVAWIPSDMLDPRARLLGDVARVLTLAGDPEAAASARRQAEALYRQKGNLVGAAAAVRAGGIPC